MGEVTEDAIRRYVVDALPGVVVSIADQASGAPEVAWGDTFIFYDPDGAPDGQKWPFATIVTKDYGDFDNVSNLDRPGVFRLNISVGPETFAALFGEDADRDFTALDTLIPHPVYGAQHWVSVLNPSEATFERIKPLLAEAHQRAAGRYRTAAETG